MYWSRGSVTCGACQGVLEQDVVVQGEVQEEGHGHGQRVHQQQDLGGQHHRGLPCDAMGCDGR